MPFPSPVGIANILGPLFTTRTRRLLLPLVLFTFTALYLLPLPSLLPSSPSLHVAIINAPRYHFEVVTPLLYTFSKQRSISRLDLIATTASSSRFGIRKFLDAAVAPKPLSLIPPESVVRDEAWNPDILLLVSCMHDLSSEAEVRATVERVLNSNTKASVVCVLHEVRMWNDPASEHRAFLKKWASRVRFMVLSEHVAISLRKELPDWDIGTPEILPVFVPVFPIADSDLNFSAKEPQQKSIGIPGKYEPWRRTYKPIFSSFSEHSPTLRSRSASLHLVGFGEHPGPVAANATDLITFHDSLDFDAYWRTLRGTLAIATAFANEHYIKDQASSTVATALIVGVPLICGKEVLQAYTYLTEEDVWLLNEGEGVVEGFLRVLEMGEVEWRRKKEVVGKRREECERGNGRWVGEFLEGRWKGGV
ncbi:hypothetical protein K440DRAFT_622565 [Wilcoxina mikolae CBS 423.85]|nr:hypothetical protein K440DRAFT_622565 [Wilcoxina mikolae CBS 423.85]